MLIETKKLKQVSPSSVSLWGSVKVMGAYAQPAATNVAQPGDY
jgi:hypothetical protein